MELQKLESYYQDIAEIVNGIIPESWSKFLLYSDDCEDSQNIFIYYYPIGSATPIDAYDILKKGANMKKFNIQIDDLTEVMAGLRNEFISSKQKPWTSITYMLDANGYVNVDFDYDDLSEINDIERKKMWKRKYLQII